MTSMRDLSKLSDNSQCADCDAKDPDWTSINLGVFLCIKCAGLHRNLGVHHSKVRSIDLDTTCWDTAQVEFMKSMGNVTARKFYERYAPGFYARPTETESAIVRENWIRAKYVRKEFIAGPENDEKDGQNPAIFLMPERAKEGFMEKMNPKGIWQKRWFILHLKHLYYFDEPNDSYPNGSIDVTEISTLVPETPDPAHKNMFIIQGRKKGDKKDYPVACDKVEDMFSWLHAIRRAQLYYQKLTQSISSQDVEEKPVNTNVQYQEMTRIRKAGELSKQGGTWKSWNTRYCVLLEDGTFYYFSQKPKQTDKPEGGLRLDHCDVVDAESKVGAKHKHSFSIIAPHRVYFLSADTAAEMHSWTQMLQDQIESLRPREKCDFVDMRVLR